MTGAVEHLSKNEADRKAELVATVDRTIAGFVECGNALAEIRDSRLYRDEHATFDAFVLQRWNISARRARQLMTSAEIVNALPSGTAVPLAERHARELMPLRDDPERMAEAMQLATSRANGNVTAADVAAAVAEVLRRDEPHPGWNGKYHPLCELLPWNDENLISCVARSVQRWGMVMPVVLMPDGTLLDGRIRMLAGAVLGQEEYAYTIYDGPPDFQSVYRYWHSLNIMRRHLTEGQRAAIAVNLEKRLLQDAAYLDREETGILLALNLQRRHLTEGQRAAIAVRVEKLLASGGAA